ncbi:FtsX-like permease family protein [Actinomadura scrupuli]|uniref:FtsX-like permease family protein n=1 Tax=Actinomadura scrupuli TaxID=559629 RepID=UPI003D99ECBE
MGRITLILRLAGRDLRRRPLEAALVLLVIAVTTTTLTVGLALHGVTDHPYRQTREATAGPDVVAGFLREDGRPIDRADVDALVRTPGVTGHSGPYPLVNTTLQARGHSRVIQVAGRDQAAAPIDQPKVTQGSWVRDGGVVLERGFADALGVHVGDQVGLGGRTFRVAGTAVTAALPAYPSSLCHILCFAPVTPGAGAFDIGLAWLTAADTHTLIKASEPVVYLVNLRLTDPAAASAFAAAHDTRPGPGVAAPFLLSWQTIQHADTGVVRTEQAALQVGGWLLALLAVAALAVLAGRRMVEQTRRVGLLKAVGGTPGLVAAVLLVEHLALASLAAVIGLATGRVLAPRFTGAGAGLVGAPGAPNLTPQTVGIVVAAALAVAVAATLVPAFRAAGTTTVSALNDPARPPRRGARLIAVSARLPVPLLLGLRLIARRPPRAILHTLSTAVTVTGLVTILTSATVTSRYTAGIHNLRAERIDQVMTTITVMLLVLAAVNTVFMTWATVTDARHTTALARAFGATPQQISAGLSAAQLLPALLGTAIGLPAGLFLYRAVTQEQLTLPPLWQLLAVLLGTLLAVAAFTAVPAKLGARRSVAGILSSDAA